MERELVIKVECKGVDDDSASVLIYRLGDRVSLVATAERGGDAEVVLDKTTALALAEALRKVS